MEGASPIGTVGRRCKMSTNDGAAYGARVVGAIRRIDRHTNFGDAKPRAHLDGANVRGEHGRSRVAQLSFRFGVARKLFA